ncbi:GNAT family N-acetyltransferase [Isoptericola sediminis]|uniref:GNAT family N-acetyltransferase n=1 Tax=Isoptericola sediminis TaxID=2733572 RepID=A0A849K5S8_9MICO|nr:GNAT family protein [Isoptericola sediminis]NNU28758.1 GNAT family N-acetyltransferase [Isoptericola sediminis]
MPPFVLRSPEVLLSVPTPADIDRIAVVCTDPAIAEWTTVPSPYTRADAETFVTGMVVDGWARETMFTWAVRAPGRPDGTVLGMMAIGLIPGGPGDAHAGEIGFWTAPDARGRGLTTAAGRLAADWALDPSGLALERLQWRGFEGNWASRRVAWKLGFRYEGLLRRHGVRNGTVCDDWIASLLPEDPREASEPWPQEAPTS